ncbi:hypothetical protein Q9K01_10450 [Qipengyuania sp. DY56-A-20]|jgi:hypothetical protein|uniref:Uncharacterized protein n=1 Tax=Qipengyuania benthica TaxID=3067651 RepID=A0ABT9H9P9_9SPHN|nr:hypothetical protein [Qipengyuania sp. DY56-A-20]MDP4540046.1 hypothetical protein [Qipengyuania sp. DY56-A-20]
MNEAAEIVPHLPWIIGSALALGALGTLGWIHTTRLKIKHGYPLEGMWGQSLKPSTDGQTAERVRLLTQENAELRAELGSMKDRLVNVERIVTDSGYHLTGEIDRLRDHGGAKREKGTTQ